MPYQKMTKEEMKKIYQMILEEIQLEQINVKVPLLSNFEKLGKETLKRLQKKSGVKEKRKLRRLFEKFRNSNGKIEKLKNCKKLQNN